MLFICEQFSSTSYNLYYMCLNYLELLEVPKTIGFPIGKHPISSLSIPSPDPWHSPAPTPPSQISVTALGPLHGMPELYILRQATQQGSPALLMTSLGFTWWLIPLSKWVITPVINGIRSGLIHLYLGWTNPLTIRGMFATKYPIYWGLFHIFKNGESP